ncbi:MAG: TylF/MycF family methyltransferase [Pseudomonadales bacterium]|nr:TylF/MycF family methyltransferase [Pseudomonadales bacterium]
MTPYKLRHSVSRIRVALSDTPMIPNPTYADDGLISQHITDFLLDKKFMDAYGAGAYNEHGRKLKNHPGDIHFRAYINCWAAQHALGLEGDFVECGVGTGIYSGTVAHYLEFENIQKKYYLCDTYTGIPVEDSINESERNNMERLNNIHFNYDYSEEVRRSFKNYPNVIIVKGKVPDSLSTIQLDRISYLSIDMNNATAEIAAIEYLWDKLVFGGVVVLDDYAYGQEFIEQKHAWDKFALEHNFTILSLPTGQGLIIKNTI